MNEVLTLDNYMISIPQALNHSSDSSVEEFDKIVEDERLISDNLIILKDHIGEELFNKLSYDDRMLMANTAGTIDFGHPVDLENVKNEIENYDHSK